MIGQTRAGALASNRYRILSLLGDFREKTLTPVGRAMRDPDEMCWVLQDGITESSDRPRRPSEGLTAASLSVVAALEWQELTNSPRLN
jgi:hypothetical protein